MGQRKKNGSGLFSAMQISTSNVLGHLLVASKDCYLANLGAGDSH